MQDADLVDRGSVMGGKIGGWGSRGDWEEQCAALLRVREAADTAFPPPPHQGEKGDSKRGVHLLSLSVPAVFSQLVCGSLLWRLLPPSAVDKNWT